MSRKIDYKKSCEILEVKLDGATEASKRKGLELNAANAKIAKLNARISQLERDMKIREQQLAAAEQEVRNSERALSTLKVRLFDYLFENGLIN